MASLDYALSNDDDFDDLPRTFRREREAQERQAREREAFRLGAMDRKEPPLMAGDRGFDAPFSAARDYGPTYTSEPVPAIVKRLDVPFVRLSVFFLKAVVAAIPALVLLGALFWLAGSVLQTYFPWLAKMQIFIHFPQ